jgi:hypothetical protein
MSQTLLLALATQLTVAPKTESGASIAFRLEAHFIALYVKYSCAVVLVGTLGTHSPSFQVRRRHGVESIRLKMTIEGPGPLYK